MTRRFHWSVYADYARRASAVGLAVGPDFIVAMLDGSKVVFLDEQDVQEHFQAWLEIERDRPGARQQ